MSTGLNITIYDDSGQEQIVNDLKFNSGVIVTKEMQKGAPKIVTTMCDIKASDYGIIDIGLKQFDDDQSLEEKINSCVNRIYIYEQELKSSETFLQRTYNTEFNRISADISSYKDELAYGIASGVLDTYEQEDLREEIARLEEELNKRLILRTTKSIELTPKGTIDKLMTYDDYIYDEAIKEQKVSMYE